MAKFRKNVMSALSKDKDYGFEVIGTEWWNGEGIDFTFYNKDNIETTYSLHMAQLEHIVTITKAFKMIDLKECKVRARNLKNEN